MAIYRHPPPTFVGGRQPAASPGPFPVGSSPTTSNVTTDFIVSGDILRSQQEDWNSATAFLAPAPQIYNVFVPDFASDFGLDAWTTDQPTGIEWGTTGGLSASRNAGVPVDWTSGVAVSGLLAVDLRQSALADTVAWAEFRLTRNIDAATTADWLGVARTDAVAPAEFKTARILDVTASAEAGSGAVADAPSSTEFEIGRYLDATTSAEFRLTWVADAVTPADWRGSISLGNIASADFLSAQILSVVSPTDSQGSASLVNWPLSLAIGSGVQSLAVAPVEYGGATGVVGDANIPLDWRSVAVSDTPWFSDWRSIALMDAPNQTETSATTRSALVLTTDWSSQLVADQIAFPDRMLSVGLNAILPAEYGGAAGIVQDANVPLDWRTTAVQQMTVLSEWSFTFQLDRLSPLDVTRSAVKDNVLNADYSKTIARDDVPQAGWASTFYIDDSNPVEWGYITRAETAAAVSWSVTAMSSYPSSLDWTAPPPPISGDAIFSIEWTALTHQTSEDAQFSVEWNTQRDAYASFTLMWTKPKLTKGAQVAAPSAFLSLASPSDQTTKGAVTASSIKDKST